MMANYFVPFSCLFDVGAAANVEAALAIHANIAAENDGIAGFEAAPSREHGTAVVWMHSDDGDPEQVVEFVLRCATAFGLSGRWGFRFALTCSRPRLDGHGGGAHVVDLGTRRTVAWIDCEHWLMQQLTPATERVAEAAP